MEEAAQLRHLLAEARSSWEAESQARGILRDCGAVVYMLLATEKHRLLAKHALQDLPLLPDEKEYLLHIPDQILEPSEAFRDVLPA